jgi:gas vesicle protein
MTISDQFREFWGGYGQFIGIIAGGFVGAAASLMFNRRKKKNQNE